MGQGLRANEQSPPLTFARFARNRFGEAHPPLLVCSQGHDPKSKGQVWRRGRGRQGEGKAKQEDEAMIYLLKPSLPFVAGLTLGLADATATAVAKIRIKQFLAIPLAGKVVAPCPVMAMPLFLYRDVESHSRTHGRTPRIASGGDRYRHEDVSRMAGRTHEERRAVAQRQECRGRHVEHQPAVAEEG